MKDICWSVFLLFLYYWWVTVDLDLDIKYKLSSAQLNTNKDKILKSNLAAVQLLDHLGTPPSLGYFLLEDR